MITKFARFEVRKESLPKALELVRAFVDEVERKEGGTARYESWQDVAEPTRFTHLMTFRTPAAEKYHQGTAWHKRFLDGLQPLCSQVPAYSEAKQIKKE